jgi:hypothetical protein
VGVSFSSSLTLPRVAVGISAGTTVLALAGVVTAAVLIFTASFAVLWPLLIGCACVAAIGLVIFAVAVAIAGFQAWHRKAPAQEIKEKKNENEEELLDDSNNEKQEKSESKTTDILEVTPSNRHDSDQSSTILHDSNELNLLNANLNDNRDVAPKAPALVVTIGQQENVQVLLRVVNCVVVRYEKDIDVNITTSSKPADNESKAAYSEFELTLTAKDEFLSTFKSSDALFIRGNFCGLRWEEDAEIFWDRKQDIKLKFCGKFIIDKDKYLRNENGILCEWEFCKNCYWKNCPYRILKLRNPTDG